MEKMYKILALLVGLVISAHSASFAGCSGQFTLNYPGAASPVGYNNGTTPPAITYCPNGQGTVTFTLTDNDNTGGSTMRIYVGKVADNGSIPTQTPLQTVTTTQGGSVNFTLAVGSSGATDYTVVNTIGCQNAKPVYVPLALTPSLNLSAAVNGTTVTSPICPGTNVTLTATGATANATYTFRDASGTIVGENTSGTLQVTPTTSTSYTVATTTPTCGTSTVTQVISISANELTASASPSNITALSTSTLTVSGGTGTYQWYANSGNGNVLIATTTDPSITVRPLFTTQYTVRGTTATGNCPDEAITRVIVDGNPLPVTLTNFTASRQSQNVYVKWATATEKNNAYFEVQRSNDSKTFTAVSKVTGNGTTATGASYSFTDRNPLAATSYYRLRQVDNDATETYSSVVAVSGADKIEASFYPNPSNSTVTLPAVNGLVKYRVYTATGQSVAAGEAQGGSEINIQKVPAGIYFLELISADKHNVQRFVKQ